MYTFLSNFTSCALNVNPVLQLYNNALMPKNVFHLTMIDAMLVQVLSRLGSDK